MKSKEEILAKIELLESKSIGLNNGDADYERQLIISAKIEMLEWVLQC